MNSMNNMNNMNSAADLDFMPEPVAQVYYVKAVADTPLASLPAGMQRLPLGRSDGKKGKADRCIVIPECSSSVLQLLLACPEGEEWMKGQVQQLRKVVALALHKQGKVISSQSLGIDALREALRNCSAGAMRLTRESIAQWFAAPDGMKQLLAQALVARGMRDDAIAATTAAFLVTFQKLAARKDNFWLTPQEKGQLEKAMLLLQDGSDYAVSPMTEAIAEMLLEIPAQVPVAMMDAL